MTRQRYLSWHSSNHIDIVRSVNKNSLIVYLMVLYLAALPKEEHVKEQILAERVMYEALTFRQYLLGQIKHLDDPVSDRWELKSGEWLSGSSSKGEDQWMFHIYL